MLISQRVGRWKFHTWQPLETFAPLLRFYSLLTCVRWNCGKFGWVIFVLVSNTKTTGLVCWKTENPQMSAYGTVKGHCPCFTCTKVATQKKKTCFKFCSPIFQYVGASVILLLLQRDGYLLDRLSSENYFLPLMLVTAFVLNISSFVNSSYFNYVNTIHLFTGSLEILLLLVTLPMYAILVSQLWFQVTVLPARLVVFLTPLNVFLFIFGSTYMSWVTAAYGLLVSAWLMKYKLPLET